MVKKYGRIFELFSGHIYNGAVMTPPSIKRILIVLDFGNARDAGHLLPLRDAIYGRSGFEATIIDLRRMILDENSGRQLTNVRLIDLAAIRLAYRNETYTIVIFGKSAMLAGGVKDKRILFIDPEYDSEWPWKKQYYADQKQIRQYDYNDKMRYGLITRSGDFSDFWDYYPRMVEVKPESDDDLEALAEFICGFADNSMTLPLEEVYEAIRKLPGSIRSKLHNICDFEPPLRIDGLTLSEIRFGVPLANGQSCYKLKLDGERGPIPLEVVHTRRGLNMLRDAIVLEGKARAYGKQPDDKDEIFGIPIDSTDS